MNDPYQTPPQVTKRNYQNVKNYLGITAVPLFSLNQKVIPQINLSKNVDPSKELEFIVLSAEATFIPGGNGWDSTAMYPLVIPCPESQEHLYTAVSLSFHQSFFPFGATLDYSATFNIYASSQAKITTTPASFIPPTNPSDIPSLILIHQETTAANFPIAPNTALPIYIPPNGFLVVFPTTITGINTYPNVWDAYYVNLIRIKRLAGVGPLVR